MNTTAVLKYGQQAVLQSIEGFPETALETPGACGLWSVKDIIAHLASREMVLVDVLAKFVGEHSTPYFDKMAELGQEQFSYIEVDTRKGCTMQQLLDEFNNAHKQVMALAEQIRPETFSQIGTIPWYGVEYDLNDFIVYTSYGHKREHSAQIVAFRNLVEGKTAPLTNTLTRTTVEVVKRFEDALNRRDLDEMMGLVTEDTVFENTSPAPDGSRYEGKSTNRAFWEDLFASTSHADFQTEDLFAVGDRCIVRWVYHWHNTAGENGHIRGIDLIVVRDGKIAEDFSYVKG